MLKRPFLFAVGLGVATCFLIGLAATRLPYSRARDAITDALALPGGLIAGLFYPQGIHTGRGAPGWAWLAMLSNWVFYILLWYICLKAVGRIDDRTHGHDDARHLGGGRR